MTKTELALFHSLSCICMDHIQCLMHMVFSDIVLEYSQTVIECIQNMYIAMKAIPISNLTSALPFFFSCE